MIRIYPITNLNYNIFSNEQDLAFFRKNNIITTEHISGSDLFLGRKMDINLFKMVDSWLVSQSFKMRPILVWTHEPRFCKTDQHILAGITSSPIHIMNMYTHNVYFSNFTIYGSKIDRNLKPVSEVGFSKKPICALTTYVFEEEQKFILNGIDIDLAMKRQNLIYEGYQMGLVDIYGRGWADTIRISESRDASQWQGAKLKILKNYQFNICMENTSFPYYCTEKIWDSIKCYCLPVYSSFNTRIYEVFPHNSFVDFDEFENNSELFTYLQRMSQTEYLRRLNVCIETFNDLYNNIDFVSERQKSLEAAVIRIRGIVNDNA